MTFFKKVNRNRGCGEGIQEVSALCRCSQTPIFSSICKNLRLFSWYSVSCMYPIWRNVSYPLPTDFFCMLLFLQLTPWNNYVKINIWGETSVINWKDSEVSSKSRYYWVGNSICETMKRNLMVLIINATRELKKSLVSLQATYMLIYKY